MLNIPFVCGMKKLKQRRNMMIDYQHNIDSQFFLKGLIVSIHYERSIIYDSRKNLWQIVDEHFLKICLYWNTNRTIKVAIIQDSLVYLYPVSPGGCILHNYMTIVKPRNWHWNNPHALLYAILSCVATAQAMCSTILSLPRSPCCYSLIFTAPFPPSPTLTTGNH